VFRFAINGVQRTARPTFGLRLAAYSLESKVAGCDWTSRAMRNRNANMNSFRATLIGLIFLSSGGFIARAQPEEKSSAPLKAIAVLHPTGGNKLSGTVTFTEVADGVQVQAEITGLTPGNHGFHVHEFGDCSAADASSAGAHFNPTNKPHAGPDATERHVGDMGNVEADTSGKAKLEYVDHQISLTNDQQSVIGRSVVVHAKADDLKSQPSGDSGARIACGVIGRAKNQ
jgi:Cu-Zn family superoxide dismutase